MTETLELQTTEARPKGRAPVCTAPPQQMSGSMVARTLRFTLNPDRFFADAHRRYGDMFTMRVLGQRWVAVAHPTRSYATNS